MKSLLSILLLVLGNLSAFVFADADSAVDAAYSRVHARDVSPPGFTAEFTDAYVSKRAAPPVPKGKDPDALHIWMRRDKNTARYPGENGATHDHLHQLMDNMGGNHKDLVIGNAKVGYWEYGLMWRSGWRKYNNGDGAPIKSYAGKYQEVAGGNEDYVYLGQLKDKRLTFGNIETIAEREIEGKKYDHRLYNCADFAQQLAHKLIY